MHEIIFSLKNISRLHFLETFEAHSRAEGKVRRVLLLPSALPTLSRLLGARCRICYN